MIIFPASYPFSIKNETLGTICGIASGATLNLGPSYFSTTRDFYANYAEEAYEQILSGNLSAKDALGVTLDPGEAAATFSNVRGDVISYELGQQVFQEETNAAGPLLVSSTLVDGDGDAGAAGQILSSSATGTKWVDLSVTTDTSLTGAGTAADPLKVSNPSTGTNTGDQLVDGTTIIGAGSNEDRIRANVPSLVDGKLYAVVNGSYAEATKSHIGLSNVDNIQQMPLSYLSNDSLSGVTGASATKVSTQLALKNYVDSRVTAKVVVVQKTPLFGQFSSIAAAVDSITDSSASNPYVVYVGPGVYTEPLIDLSSKPFVQIVGYAIQSAVVQPDAANHHAIKMGINSEISFFTIKNVGSGYAAIAVDDTGYYAQAHKISISDSSTGVLVKSVTQDTYFYGEYIDINDDVDFGVKVEATNSFVAYTNVENFYVYPTVDNPTVGMHVSGPGSIATVSLSGFISDSAWGGIGVEILDGADVSIKASTFSGLDKAIYAPDGAGYDPCNLVVDSVVLQDNVMDVEIVHTGTTGFFDGSIDYSKKSIPAEAPFYQYNVDPKTVTVATKGGDFSSIAAAVDSITDSSDTNRYIVKVGSGVFTEPLIDLSAKSYITIIGADIQSTVILPATNTQHIFKMGHFTELSYMTIKNTGTGYAGVIMDDIDGWCLLNKLSFYDCATCVYVHSATNDTYLYGEFVDYNDSFGKGVHILAENGAVAQAELTNSTYYPTTVTATGSYGAYLSGAGALLTGSAFGSDGIGGGIGVYLENGASAAISSAAFKGWDKGILVANVGSASSLITKATICRNNTTLDLAVKHPSTTGSFFGDIDSSKVEVDSDAFGIVYQDAGTGGFTVSDKLNIRFSNDITTDVTTLIAGTASMGLLSGGSIGGATGLMVSVGSGTGYLVDQLSGFVKKVEWAGSNLTLDASSDTYIGIDSDGQVFTSPSISHIYNVRLGRVITADTYIDAVVNVPIEIAHHGNLLETTLRKTLGGVFGTGCATTVTAGGGNGRKVDVSAGSYYYGSVAINPSATSPTTFCTLYRDGSSGWAHVENQTEVPNTQYDNGTGTLATMTDSYYAVHHLYTSEDGALQKRWLIQSQGQHASLSDARAASLPIVPAFIKDSIVPISAIIIQKSASTIAEIIDIRTRLGFTPNASSGVTIHGDLQGLSNDDHTQYLLVSGTRAMSGDLFMGNHGITGVSTINGVNIVSHASRHLPNGADPIATAAPTTDLTGSSDNTEGIQNSLARSDHSHKVVLTKSDVGLGNVTNESKATMFTSPVFTGTAAFDGATGISASEVGAEPYLGLPLGNDYVLAGSTGGARTWISAPQRAFTESATDIKMDGVQSLGVLDTLPRADHVHPSDTSRAPIASPGFTGIPTAPTATTGTSTTQLATTAFVANAITNLGGMGTVQSYTQTFNQASLSGGFLTVTHNLSSTGVTVAVYDNNGYMVIPSSIAVTSADVVTLGMTDFPTLSGTWSIVVQSGGTSVVKTGTIGVVVDNGASTIVTGVKKVYMNVPYDCTITGWKAFTGGATGSAAVSLLKCTYATFPPTSANNICGSSYITLSSASKNQSTAGWDSGWTKALSAGDILGIEVLSSPTPSVYNLSVMVDILKA